MANIKNIKFLRNGKLYASHDAAIAALQGFTGKTAFEDGIAALARYSGTSETDVKTLVGFCYLSGATKAMTIFDVEAASADVDALRTEINNKLGEGITSANTATAQLDALRGSTADTSASTSVAGAKAYAKDYTDEKISGLDYSGVTADDNKAVYNVTQADGTVAAHAKNISAFKLDGYAEGSDAKVADTDTLGEALGKLQGQINAMDLSVVSGDGEVIVSVSEADGKVSATKSAIKDVKLTGYVKDTSKTGGLEATDDIEDALSKIENNIAAISAANTLSAADKSVNVVTADTGTTVGVNIRSGEKVLMLDTDATSGGVYTDIDLVKITDGLPETVKERYQLLASDDSQIGTNIDIPKDSHIVSINYITGGTHAQNLEYVYIDASGETQTTYVDMSELVLEAEFASGVTVTDHIAHGVVDPTSEGFLTVGAGGFKLSGVQSAIDSAINALDVTGDTAVAGQYVAAIEETDGVVAVKSRVNVSDAPLNGYSKGTDASAVTATDTVKEAISKLENQIDKAAASAAAASTKVEKDASASHLTITSSTDPSTSAVTYTIGEDDIASASALTAEIAARKAVDGQTGDTYAANTASTHISGATSLNDADVKLSAAIDGAVSDLASEIAHRKAVDGINGDAYSANTGANYISTATNLNDADVKLDAQAKVNADDILKNKVKAGNGINVSGGTSTTDGTTITAVAKSGDPVIEVTSAGIGIKAEAVWDCGCYDDDEA